MFKGLSNSGFTIVEVMIFLTISIIVFASAVLTINRQNSRTAFAQSARDVELQLQDVFNDVENGYYPSSNNFSCTYNGDTPNISTNISKQQGTNENCTFVGKAVQFGRNGSKDELAVSTIVGKRTDGGKTVTNIQDASPTLLELINPGDQLKPDVYKINSGVEIKGLYYNDPYFGQFIKFSGVAVISGFPEQSGGLLQSGIVRTALLPLGFTFFGGEGVGSSDSSFLSYVNNTDGTSIAGDRGVVLCLQEKGGGRIAEVDIGVDSQRLATNSIIDPSSGVCTS